MDKVLEDAEGIPALGGRPRIRERHGGRQLKEYRSWDAMRQRCLNPKCVKFRRYGARGIKICRRWDLFSNFFTDMGPRPKGKSSIERINNNGDYTPANCKWANHTEQARNHSRVKLSMRVARQIRVLHFDRNIRPYQLAKRFSIGRDSISLLLKNKTWKEETR